MYTSREYYTRMASGQIPESTTHSIPREVFVESIGHMDTTATTVLVANADGTQIADLPAHTGLVVAFVGPVCSGKSTLATAVSGVRHICSSRSDIGMVTPTTYGATAVTGRGGHCYIDTAGCYGHVRPTTAPAEYTGTPSDSEYEKMLAFIVSVSDVVIWCSRSDTNFFDSKDATMIIKSCQSENRHPTIFFAPFSTLPRAEPRSMSATYLVQDMSPYVVVYRYHFSVVATKSKITRRARLAAPKDENNRTELPTGKQCWDECVVELSRLIDLVYVEKLVV